MLCLDGRLGRRQHLLGRREPRLGHQGEGACASGTRTARAMNIPSAALGANFVPSLSPDGEKMAFLHSARDDGRYDIWVGAVDAHNAEQITNTRNVSDVVWSPEGDWLAYVQNWSDETLEGQISLVRPNGDDAKTLVDGDAPCGHRTGSTSSTSTTEHLDDRQRRQGRDEDHPERPLAGLVPRRQADRLHACRALRPGALSRSTSSSLSRTAPASARSARRSPEERRSSGSATPTNRAFSPSH